MESTWIDTNGRQYASWERSADTFELEDELPRPRKVSPLTLSSPMEVEPAGAAQSQTLPLHGDGTMIRLTWDATLVRAISRCLDRKPKVRIEDFARGLFEVESTTQTNLTYQTHVVTTPQGFPVGSCACPARGLCIHILACAGIVRGVAAMRHQHQEAA